MLCEADPDMVTNTKNDSDNDGDNSTPTESQRLRHTNPTDRDPFQRPSSKVAVDFC